MCFYPTQEKRNELTLDEIRKLAKSMPPQWFLMLTGGEPFLRDDIAEIAGAFYDRGAIGIHFSTNGFLVGKTLDRVRAIAEYCKESTVIIDTSIDGPEELHDSIRQTKGAFRKTVETTRELVEMKQTLPNLGVAVNFTLSAYNQNCWKDVVDFAREDLKVDAVNIGLTRGNTREEGAGEFDIGEYWKAHRYLIKTNRRQFFAPTARWLAMFKDVAQIENIYKIANSNPPGYYRCLAGRVFNVITEEGDVFPCEMLDRKMGSLRAVDMDFEKIIESDAAKEIIEYISKRECLCTYECAMTASLAASFGTAGQFIDFLLHYRQKTREYYDG